ncbi:YadA-like family protein, partial [Escherichia coli]|nr:YadA-like family protein [Escherichia coli]
SSAVAGLMFVSFSSLSAKPTDRVVGKYTIKFFGENGEQATIFDSGNNKVIIADTVTGTITTFNRGELEKKVNGIDVKKNKDKVQSLLESVRYTIDAPELKKENIGNITEEKLNKLKETIDIVSETITTKTARAYNTAINNGVSVESALAAVKQDSTGGLLNEFNRLGTNVNDLKNATTFALDENGEITDGQGVESVSVKSVVAGVKADTTIYQNKDGSYTLDQSAPGNVRVNDAVVSLDNRTRSNTQAIQNHSRQLQEHNARLNSQQRQIRENHEEMKRAAAQSAALSGLFQPYSVGKFNATAALGGYSDKQAVAVGVGYRFNEQTAAKAGIAASDGDVSYNVGVNFEF